MLRPTHELEPPANPARFNHFSGGTPQTRLMPSEVRRLKLLEDENARLKQMVADLSLDKAMLQDVLSKKV